MQESTERRVKERAGFLAAVLFLHHSSKSLSSVCFRVHLSQQRPIRWPSHPVSLLSLTHIYGQGITQQTDGSQRWVWFVDWSCTEDYPVGPFKSVFPCELAVAAEEDPLASCPESEGLVVGFLATDGESRAGVSAPSAMTSLNHAIFIVGPLPQLCQVSVRPQSLWFPLQSKPPVPATAGNKESPSCGMEGRSAGDLSSSMDFNQTQV